MCVGPTKMILRRNKSIRLVVIVVGGVRSATFLNIIGYILVTKQNAKCLVQLSCAHSRFNIFSLSLTRPLSFSLCFFLLLAFDFCKINAKVGPIIQSTQTARMCVCVCDSNEKQNDFEINLLYLMIIIKHSHNRSLCRLIN